jgi:hypothetical protein
VKQAKELKHFQTHHVRKVTEASCFAPSGLIAGFADSCLCAQECKGAFVLVPVKISKDEAVYIRDHLAATAPMEWDDWKDRVKPKIMVDDDLKVSALIA